MADGDAAPAPTRRSHLRASVAGSSAGSRRAGGVGRGSRGVVAPRPATVRDDTVPAIEDRAVGGCRGQATWSTRPRPPDFGRIGAAARRAAGGPRSDVPPTHDIAQGD